MHKCKTLLFIFIFCIQFVHGFKCGQSSVKPTDLSNSRIFNGIEARPHSWPWMVTLQHPLIGHSCGGSLIDANYVISAAHCFFSVFFYDSMVYIGNHDINDRFEQRNISKVIIHPSYELVDGNPNDIVLLELDRPVDISLYPIICLPTVDTNFLELPGQRLTVVGWGLVNETYSSTVLIQTTLTIHDSSIPECRPYINDTTKQLCVGVIGGGTGTCSGDSGGPLMAEFDGRYYLIGIVSTGINGCGKASTLYIRIRVFLPWICEQNRNISQCSTVNNETLSSSTITLSTVSTTSLNAMDSTTIKDDSPDKTPIIIVATVVTSVIIIIGTIVGIFVWHCKKKQRQNQ